MMRLGLLICDHVPLDLVDVSGDYPRMFRRLFADFQDIDLVEYEAVEGELPTSPTECDAWITTGSSFSVNDSDSWIRRLESFIQAVADKGVPFVGVCFGHQLAALAIEGKIGPSPHGWGLGLKRVHLAPDSHLFPKEVGSLRVVHSHRDEVAELPPDAYVIGSSDSCSVSMMTVGESILGIQGHPEMDIAYDRCLIEARRGHEIPEDVADMAVSSLVAAPDHGVIAVSLARFLASAGSHR